MKAITLREPWATGVALGLKGVETRGRRTNYRGLVGIHAAKADPGVTVLDNAAYTVGADDHRGPALWLPYPPGVTGRCRGCPVPGAAFGDNDHPEAAHFVPLALGAIVAVAELYDCVPIIADPEQARAPWATAVGREVHVMREGWHPLRFDDEAAWGDYRPGRWAWLLRDVHPLADPVPCRGNQATPWNAPSAVAALVAAQVPVRV